MENGITFEDWVYLQKCLKYERLRLSHGNIKADENEKKELLAKLEELHKEYYKKQLLVREAQGTVSAKQDLRSKKLLDDTHASLGDNFRYAESLVLNIRSSHEMFRYIAFCCRQRMDNIDSLVESFAYSFFLDLVHPENAELELVQVIHDVLESELLYLKDRGHISNLLNENYVLRNFLKLYTKRRNQRKYMKLVFKKPLREIILDQDSIKDLKLDPRKIYLAEKEKFAMFKTEEVTQVKKRKSFFGTTKKPKSKPVEEPVREVTEEEALEMPQVMDIIKARSEIIISHCKSLLDSLYKNVRTMPHGLRGICRKMIELIDKITPGVLEREKFSLLGNFLFTFWWIPAIFDPIKNGLLQNVIINASTLSYLKTIGTVRLT